MSKKKLTEEEQKANANTHFSHVMVEELRMKLAKHDCDYDADDRVHVATECKPCYYFRRGGLAGQAFTYRDCDSCGVRQTFSTTDTRKLCEACARNLGQCRRCKGWIDGVERK